MSKALSVSVLLDEGADLGVFVHHFLSSHLSGEQLLQLRIAELWSIAVIGLQRFEDVGLLTIQVVLRLLGQTQEGQLRGVGDEGKPQSFAALLCLQNFKVPPSTCKLIQLICSILEVLFKNNVYSL